MRLSISAAVLITATLTSSAAGAMPAARFTGAAATPLPVESVVSRIGANRAAQDRAELRRYRGNAGAQQILRQKRRNLCRNVAEMC